MVLISFGWLECNSNLIFQIFYLIDIIFIIKSIDGESVCGFIFMNFKIIMY